MRHSNRLIGTVLLVCILFSIYKFKELRDHELIDRANLLNALQEKEQELDRTTKQLTQIRTSHESLTELLNKSKSAALDKEVEHKNSLQEVEKLTDKNFRFINKVFKKWSFIKDKPRYKKVTYIKDGLETSTNDLIVLSVIGHSESYGPKRSFQDFLQLLNSMDYDWNTATLGLLVGEQAEYEKILKYLDQDIGNVFSKIVVIYANYIEKSNTVDRALRHEANIQRERRRNISKSRNFLVNNAITDESNTLFLDSDMVKVPKDMIKTFINTGKDVVVPRIAKGKIIENYDFNSWRGRRVSPNAEEIKKMDADPLYVFVPRPDGADHMHDIMHEKKKYGHDGEESFLVELDSVGGAILWMKTELFKQGVMFPTYYIIGTTWDREGFDGIETEGLCYQAKLIGYSCWGMPNYVAYHVDEAVEGG